MDMNPGKLKIPNFLVREDEPNGKLKSILSVFLYCMPPSLETCFYEGCNNEPLSIEYQDEYVKNKIYGGQEWWSEFIDDFVRDHRDDKIHFNVCLEHITKDFETLKRKHPEYIKINFVDFFIRMCHFYSAQRTNQYFLIAEHELSMQLDPRDPILIDSLIRYKNSHPKDFELKRYTEWIWFMNDYDEIVKNSQDYLYETIREIDDLSLGEKLFLEKERWDLETQKKYPPYTRACSFFPLDLIYDFKLKNCYTNVGKNKFSGPDYVFQNIYDESLTLGFEMTSINGLAPVIGRPYSRTNKTRQQVLDKELKNYHQKTETIEVYSACLEEIYKRKINKYENGTYEAVSIKGIATLIGGELPSHWLFLLQLLFNNEFGNKDIQIFLMN